MNLFDTLKKDEDEEIQEDKKLLDTENDKTENKRFPIWTRIRSSQKITFLTDQINSDLVPKCLFLKLKTSPTNSQMESSSKYAILTSKIPKTSINVNLGKLFVGPLFHCHSQTAKWKTHEHPPIGITPKFILLITFCSRGSRMSYIENI